MRRAERLIAIAILLSLGSALAGCSSGMSSFDPTDMFDFLDTKKKIPGQREPVFPNGVPGVEQGIPQDLYKSNVEQQQRENAAAAAAAATQPPTQAEPAAEPAPKPKRTHHTSRPKKPRKPVHHEAPAAEPSAPAAPAPAPAAAAPAPAPQPQAEPSSAFPAPLPSGSFQH